MSSNKKSSATIDAVLDEFKDLKKYVKTTDAQHKASLDVITELLNRIMAMESDNSTKLDFSLNQATSKLVNKNTKSDATSSAAASASTKKVTINTFFKNKYCESTDILNGLLIDSGTIDKLFKKNAESLSKKKTTEALKSAKALLIYKDLLKDDKEKMKILRSIKESEESNNIVIKPEVTENIIDDTDNSEASEEEIEEESDGESNDESDDDKPVKVSKSSKKK